MGWEKLEWGKHRMGYAYVGITNAQQEGVLELGERSLAQVLGVAALTGEAGLGALRRGGLGLVASATSTGLGRTDGLESTDSWRTAGSLSNSRSNMRMRLSRRQYLHPPLVCRCFSGVILINFTGWRLQRI